MFERETVIQQLRSLQVLETVHLMAGGKNPCMNFYGDGNLTTLIRDMISNHALVIAFKRLKFGKIRAVAPRDM